jgi:hypothetical protein
MKTGGSIFHFNMLKVRVVLVGLAGASIVALAFAKGRLSVALAVTALAAVTVVLLVSRRKPNVAFRSAASCLWLAVPTIMEWKGHMGVLSLLVPGVGSAIFGVMALREFNSQKPEDE